MIPYGRQDISGADIEAVTAVLGSDFLTQGPMVPRFEEAMAACCGAAHAVAVNSATSALHIACLALDLGEGDWLWTSPNTFVASANCALYCGARVDFVDIDPRTCNIDVQALSSKLEAARRQSRLPKVVMPVHFAGQSCDMAAIRRLSSQYGFRILEDASHAVGGRYRDAPVGSCAYSDIAVFSFHPVKIITSGEGGMALTNDPGLARRMKRLRSHGITRDPADMAGAPEGPWYYEQIELGFNYRMTDIQAALGLSQLQRLDEFLAGRRAISRRYDESLRHLPLVTPWHSPDAESGMHLYVVRLQLGEIRRSHREVFVALREEGIGVNLHYIPVYRQPHYRKLGLAPDAYPEAERYYAEAISLPMYPALASQAQQQVIDALEKVCAA